MKPGRHLTYFMGALSLFGLIGQAYSKAPAEVYPATDAQAAPADPEALLGNEDGKGAKDWASITGTGKDAEAVSSGEKHAPLAQEDGENPVVPTPESEPPLPAAPEVAQVPTTALSAKSDSSKKEVPSGWGLFDTVPDSKRNSVAVRLKLVETLIRKHGRAYDYRIHTASQLEEALRLLEREESHSRQ